MNPAPAVLGFPVYDYERWVWIPWTHCYRRKPTRMIRPIAEATTMMIGRSQLRFPASLRSRPVFSSQEPNAYMSATRIAMRTSEIGIVNLSTMPLIISK